MFIKLFKNIILYSISSFPHLIVIKKIVRPEKSSANNIDSIMKKKILEKESQNDNFKKCFIDCIKEKLREERDGMYINHKKEAKKLKRDGNRSFHCVFVCVSQFLTIRNIAWMEEDEEEEEKSHDQRIHYKMKFFLLKNKKKS